jgi:hypothetical protein
MFVGSSGFLGNHMIENIFEESIATKCLWGHQDFLGINYYNMIENIF